MLIHTYYNMANLDDLSEMTEVCVTRGLESGKYNCIKVPELNLVPAILSNQFIALRQLFSSLVLFLSLKNELIIKLDLR